VLGYKNVGDAKARQRVVDPDQAVLVLRIFTMASEGKGLLKICNILNGEGVVNPTGQSRGTEPKDAAKYWATSGIRAILHRRLYLGEAVYGQTKNARRGGKRIKLAGTNPIRIERPELRIISDELWASAHRVMSKRRAAYTRTNNGRLLNKPESGVDSRYLLGGFVFCGVCGARMTPVKRTGKRGRPSFGYMCRVHQQRGNVACSAKRSVPVRDLHEAVVAGLEQLLTPEKLDAVLRGLAREWADQHDSRDAQQAGLRADLFTVESELKNLTAAVASGAAVSTFLDGIREREARRQEIRARLTTLDEEAAAAGRASAADYLDGLRRICRDWKTLLKADPAQGRRVLRDLQIERVVVRQDEQSRWWYRLEGSLDKIVGIGGRDFAVTDSPFVVWADGDGETDDPADTADRHAEDSCPRGDSNTRHAV